MKKNYRKGAIGALMDEYERAVTELKAVLRQISDDEFIKIRDLETRNEDCRSIQTISNHVVSAGYSYADGIREKFSMPLGESPKPSFEYSEIFQGLNDLVQYTAQTLENHWELADKEILATFIESNLEFTENLEQVLEHAIVHILRHRRQIEKFLSA